MGERLLCKQEVVGSIPITSTTERAQLVSTDRTTRSAVRVETRQRCACAARAAAGAATSIGNEAFTGRLECGRCLIFDR